MKLFKTFHEARQREANRVITRYWHFVEQAQEYKPRSSSEAAKSVPLLKDANTTRLLAQAAFGSKATMRLRHAIAIVAILLISFGAKMFFFSPPTADAGMHRNTINLPAAGAHNNPLSLQIGEPPYP
jgi:hypothetical protein